jgi:glycosyltransferase involved in cell wall biosynthesis
MDDATYLDKIGQVAQAADLRSVHFLAWRDLDDPEAGGSELHASEVAARWAAAGIDVTVRTSFAANHPLHCRRDGYRVVRKAGRYLVFPRSVLSELAGRMGPRDGLVEIWNGVPFFSPLWCRGARMVFLHHPHADMWRGVLSPRLAQAGRILETRIAPPLYRNTPVVTLSESGKADIVRRLGLPADSVRVVPPGVDRRFTPGGERSRHPLVAVVGRLVPVKRIDALLRQLARVRTTIPDLEVVVGGEGYEHAALVELVGQLDAASWIHLPGRLRPDEVVELYRRAWVLASASHAEGWGMTITEAGACGTPAVVSDIAGHRDAVLHGVTGILAGTDDEVGNAIARVLSDADLRDALGRHAHARASSLSWSATALGALEVLAVDATHRRTR